MHYFIKEWPNKMVTLVSEDGAVLWTFKDVEEARGVWNTWYTVTAIFLDCNASQKPDSLLSSLSPENTFIF